MIPDPVKQDKTRNLYAFNIRFSGEKGANIV
jgi:hypothetical protein